MRRNPKLVYIAIALSIFIFAIGINSISVLIKLIIQKRIEKLQPTNDYVQAPNQELVDAMLKGKDKKEIQKKTKELDENNKQKSKFYVAKSISDMYYMESSIPSTIHVKYGTKETSVNYLLARKKPKEPYDTGTSEISTSYLRYPPLDFNNATNSDYAVDLSPTNFWGLFLRKSDGFIVKANTLYRLSISPGRYELRVSSQSNKVVESYIIYFYPEELPENSGDIELSTTDAYIFNIRNANEYNVSSQSYQEQKYQFQLNPFMP